MTTATLETPVTAPTANVLTSGEAQIRQLIDDQMSAICAKDMGRLMSYYQPDVVIFDVKPPFQLKGVDALLETWEECLPCLPDSLQTEIRDLQITASGELAFAHWLWRFRGMPEGHDAANTWLRATGCYRQIEGRWRIVHEQLSVPFDPRTSQAVFSLEA